MQIYDWFWALRLSQVSDICGADVTPSPLPLMQNLLNVLLNITNGFPILL